MEIRPPELARATSRKHDLRHWRERVFVAL